MDHYFRTDSITSLEMSVRLRNLLLRNDIKTVGALLDIKEAQWYTFRGLGAKTLEEAHELIRTLRSMSEETAPEQLPVPEEKTEAFFMLPQMGTFYETSLEEFDMSVRLQNCLHKAKIDTVGKLLEFPEDQWFTLRNMGAKSVKEVLELVASLKEQVGEAPVHAPRLNAEQMDLAKELEESYAVANVQRILFQITRDHPGCAGETLLYLSYEDSQIQNAFYKKILGLLKDKRQGLTLEQISRRLPQHLQNTTILEEALLNLQNDDKIQEMDGIYIRKFPSIMEYLATLPAEKNREIVIRRLSGGKLEEVGDQFHITRERVRQICSKICKVSRAFEEDRYRYPFETYEVDEKSFLAIFHVPVTTYHYLETVCKVKTNSRKPLIEMLEDDTFPPAVLRSAEAYIYRDYLSVDGLRIQKTRPELFRYVVKRYCRDKQSFPDVLAMYDQFLADHGLSDNPKLVVESRSYENKMAKCDYVLWSHHRHMRYYNIPKHDYSKFISEIDLSQYDNMELSTLKIFREHPDLMEEYDIRDEFELHNLLNKIWEKEGNCQVDFRKMPTIRLGEYNVEEQVLDLLLQCAPISIYDFADEYEKKYGVKAATAMGNLFHSIDTYLINGVYTIDQESLPLEQHNHMQEVLTEDFYTLEDMQRIYEREFPEEKGHILNAYNIKCLGFLINSTYAVSTKYSNAAVYIRHLLTDDDVVDASDFPRSLTILQAYQSELADLKAKREIIEFQSNKHYINIRRLEQNGITHSMLDDYCCKAESFVDRDTYFTVTSLRQDGFQHELDDLYFDEWFYSSLLAEDRERFTCQRMGGNRLFYSGKTNIQLTTFLEWILEQNTKMELDDLMDLLSQRYALFFPREKLLEVLKDTDLYYDRIMDTVYIDYDTYFEEV